MPAEGRPWRRLRARIIRNASVCAICGGLLDPSARKPHPNSTEVDHVLPLTLRPDLAMDPTNLVAAHRRCNRAKSNRLDYLAEPAPSCEW